MPLDASDKILLEEISAIFRRATDSRKLAEAGSELTRAVLEVLPPDAPFRKEILKHIKRAALLTKMALVQVEQTAASG